MKIEYIQNSEYGGLPFPLPRFFFTNYIPYWSISNGDFEASYAKYYNNNWDPYKIVLDTAPVDNQVISQ